ncbi:MAG: HU family DNA-binding protein [Bacteroides sp.]
MPLFYKAIQSPIADKNGVKKWHLSLVKVGKTVNTKQLADVIAEKSSLTVGDVQNVVTNLMVVMRRELLNSRTVRLEGLGTFTMRVRSNGKGVETAEKVNPNQVSSLQCQFTPEYTRTPGAGTTKALLQGVQFAHADLMKAYLTKEGEEGEGEPENPFE